MEIVSYSNNAFLNLGVQEILQFASGSQREYKLNSVAIDFITILDDLDITQTIGCLSREASRFAKKNVMVLTETISPHIVAYLLRSACGLVVYNTKRNHCEVMIDIHCDDDHEKTERELCFSLSDNELFILLSLSLGMKPELLAKITGRSEKRISAIKRDVMAKFQIKNSNIFYDVIKAIFIHEEMAPIEKTPGQKA